MRPRCSNCDYWDQMFHAGEGSDDADYGLCRLEPPLVKRGKTLWPTTYAHDWCGEFSEKPGDADPGDHD